MIPECSYEGCDTEAVVTVTQGKLHLNGEVDTFGNGPRQVCLAHLASACSYFDVSVVKRL